MKTEEDLFYALGKLSNARNDRHLNVSLVPGGLRLAESAGVEGGVGTVYLAPVRILPDYGDPAAYFVSDISENAAHFPHGRAEPGDRLVSVNGRLMAEYEQAVRPYQASSYEPNLRWRMAEDITARSRLMPSSFYGDALELEIEGQRLGAGDLDGDGDLDAFVANNNGGNKVWFNNGSGRFTDSGISLGNSSSHDISLGDLDGDGDLDAFVANFDQHNKSWLNNGTGTFIDSGHSPSTLDTDKVAMDDSTSVSLGDLDGDGDLDAFVTNFAESNNLWLNNGSGLFTYTGREFGNTNSMGVALGDFDGDGDLDAFVANAKSANTVWINSLE